VHRESFTVIKRDFDKLDIISAFLEALVTTSTRRQIDLGNMLPVFTQTVDSSF
jgi:hypothetical protein